MIPNPATSPDKRITAVFLIVALLLCHGVYGAGHQLSPAHDAHGEHGEKVAHPAGHLSGMAYAAMLMALFLAAASAKLVRAELGGIRPKAMARFSLRDVPRLPRGPTLHFLQVLRL